MKRLAQIQKQVDQLRKRVTKTVSGAVGVVKKQVMKRPMVSFFGALAMLFVVLTVVKVVGAPKPEEKAVEMEAKRVRIYQIGAVPTITVNAKVEKAGVVTVVAQTPGVVNQVRAFEGDAVRSGQVLVNIGSTYTGANMASLSRQIAQKSYDNAKDTFDTSLDLIGKRRELAEKTDENSDEMRAISRDSLDRTRDQLSFNEEILAAMDSNIATLETTLSSDDPAVIAAKSQKSQIVAAINGLKSAIDNTEYTSDDDKVPARLADLGKEIALKGLELEEKGLRLSLEISELNLRLARVSEMLFYPQAPFGGVVERVLVKPGEYVNPGMPLMAIAGSEQTMKAVALVGRDVAGKVSKFEVSKLSWQGKTIEQVPQYVATEPTDGNLFAITWCKLDQFTEQLTDGEYIRVELPVGYPDSIGVMPFIPLDSVYQTQDEAYVFVIGDDKKAKSEEFDDGEVQEDVGVVESRQVKLGQIYGGFVQVEEGIDGGDEVVLDRAVVTGDRVQRI